MFPAAFLSLLTVCSLIAAGGILDLELTAGTVFCGLLGVSAAAVCGGGILMASDRGVPVLAAVSALGLLLCGGLVPRQTLPASLLLLGSVTPVGAVRNFFLPAFGGRMELLPVLAAAVYAAALTAAVTRRLTRIRIGGDAA